ncbi:hypothetical protein H4Q26_003557 [Puccinia striiformis f. sp. tritici PST-130]|nr:hypothetical protein Pst134EB_014555 [Puccinia striiformis f. sp. tritici]KAI9603948.1 hypothetical protein H4Q26_003557 [Puccinia striiformis f. sp. tritici PST-130]
MHNCGKTYENVDDDMNEDDKEYESDDERNGVGADVLNEGESLGSLLSGWSESQLPQDQQLQSDGAAESGWSVTPTQGCHYSPSNRYDNLPDLSDLGTMDSSRQTGQADLAASHWSHQLNHHNLLPAQQWPKIVGPLGLIVQHHVANWFSNLFLAGPSATTQLLISSFELKWAL